MDDSTDAETEPRASPKLSRSPPPQRHPRKSPRPKVPNQTNQPTNDQHLAKLTSAPALYTNNQSAVARRSARRRRNSPRGNVVRVNHAVIDDHQSSSARYNAHQHCLDSTAWVEERPLLFPSAYVGTGGHARYRKQPRKSGKRRSLSPRSPPQVVRRSQNNKQQQQQVSYSLLVSTPPQLMHRHLTTLYAAGS